MSNSINFLSAAGLLFKGALVQGNEAFKAAKDSRNGTLLDICINLTCHAAIKVFANNDYTRAKAKRFKEDVVAGFGISEKQAGKWTESISAALGVRGVRKGVQGIPGLDVAAADGVDAVREFLKAREILTFNQFMSAVRSPVDPVQALAKSYAKLSDKQRERVQKMVADLDKDAAGEGDEA